MTGNLFDAPGPRAARRIWLASMVGGMVLVAIMVGGVVELSANGQLDADKWSPFVTNSDLLWFLLEGLVSTLEAAALALAFSLVLGTSLGVGRLTKIKALQLTCAAIVEFVRGAPVLLSILFLFLAFPLAFGINLPPFWTVVLGLTLYNAAVIAEILRAGVLVLPSGQQEAASALGLHWWQAMRLVLLPQAFRIMLPSLLNQLIVLIKDSALGFIVGYHELTAQAQSAALLFNNPLQTFFVIAVVYIILNSTLTELSTYVSRRQARAATSALA